ncbi:MAG: 6-carboxytetrahydropterin synthase [Chitinophagaceae bacterium]|nr:MAG: 6-carboxytetrahydropterin synthase [Chitinophagaceae bacterium]
MPRVAVFRKEHFNAAHRLHNPNWDNETNTAVFGLCNNPNYHGHNYTLHVEVRGEIDAETGYVYDMKKLKDIINQKIVDRFDHRNLNLDVEEFKNLNPTAENIAVIIWNILREELAAQYILAVTLYETERNYVRYAGE